MNFDALIAERSRGIIASGIRQVFADAARIPDSDPDKVNLSIGQPDFTVPEPITRAATVAMAAGHNGYPHTPGVARLRETTAAYLAKDVGWKVAGLTGAAHDPGLLITSGTSGGLVLAAMGLLNPGDELIIPDPYFVTYPALASLTGATAVTCDTYPDFKLTAQRVEPLITPRTKAILLNTPSNPAGVVSSPAECRDLLDLCRRRGVVLISDEIYDEFTFSESRTQSMAGDPARLACPSPARFKDAHDTVLLIRGFGKTYGVTGWRLGYLAGPARLVEELTKLQQYLYVCAPHPLQWGVAEAFGVDMRPYVDEYQRRRERVLKTLGHVAHVAHPGGAFYAFVEVPSKHGTATDFYQRARERKVFIVPGSAFSSRDTHFRLSYATPIAKLERGLAVLAELLA